MWSVYIVRCADDTLYTGVAKVLEDRLLLHNQGKGAKYTRTRRPVKLVYSEHADSRSGALSRESAIKKLTRAEKKNLIDAASDATHDSAV